MTHHGRTHPSLAALCLGCGLLAGCSAHLIAPPTGLIEQTPPYGYSDADWAEVLAQNVRDGLVDYQKLSQNPRVLQRYYALLSRTGPALTPDQFSTRPQSVAYWVNAYNACVLLAVLESYPISTVYDLSLPPLEFSHTFSVDGRTRNLAAMEEQVLKVSAGDVRVLFTMSAAALGMPRLEDRPLRANILEQQLSEAAARELDNPRILRIDHSRKSILVWQEVLRRQEAFLAYWRTRRRVATAFLFNVLLELASPEQRRALQGAVGYQFREMPFDRTLNDASAGAPASRAESTDE